MIFSGLDASIRSFELEIWLKLNTNIRNLKCQVSYALSVQSKGLFITWNRQNLSTGVLYLSNRVARHYPLHCCYRWRTRKHRPTYLKSLSRRLACSNVIVLLIVHKLTQLKIHVYLMEEEELQTNVVDKIIFSEIEIDVPNYEMLFGTVGHSNTFRTEV